MIQLKKLKNLIQTKIIILLNLKIKLIQNNFYMKNIKLKIKVINHLMINLINFKIFLTMKVEIVVVLYIQ